MQKSSLTYEAMLEGSSFYLVPIQKVYETDPLVCQKSSQCLAISYQLRAEN